MVMVLGACETESPRCPNGFDAEAGAGTGNGGCKIGGYADDVEADAGVAGFVKSVTGGCGPGDNSCSVTYEDDHPVEIYAIDEGLTLEDCNGANLPVYLASTAPSPIAAPGGEPALVVHTDDHGRFWAALPPGNYCVTSTDTIDDTLLGRTVVVPEALINATFIFDHGGY